MHSIYSTHSMDSTQLNVELCMHGGTPLLRNALHACSNDVIEIQGPFGKGDYSKLTRCYKPQVLADN
jgi:hypothetical protein